MDRNRNGHVPSDGVTRGRWLLTGALVAVLVVAAGAVFYLRRGETNGLTYGTVAGAQVADPVIGGQRAQVIADAKPGPRPALVFAHGVDGDRRVSLVSRAVAFTRQLVDDGWVVASSDAHGNAWGSPASQRDYLALIGWLRGHYQVSGVVLLGESMGGVATLNLVASGDVPDLRGWVGVSPVTNLAGMTNFNQSIDHAMTFAQQHQVDPMNLPPASLAAVPLTIVSSPADVIAPPAREVTPFTQHVPGVQVRSCTGGHIAADCYQAAAVEALVSP